MHEVHFDKEEGSKLKLFTPGPVDVSEQVLQELSKPNDTHRSTSYEEMHESVIGGLKELLFTKNNCFIFTSSASGVMEACVRNLIKKDDKALFFSVGAFGDRWFEMGKGNGKNATKEGVKWGEVITSEFAKEALSKDCYDVVFIQSNETSTGVYNPINEIVPIIKDTGALVCVDATSSMAGVKVEVDTLGIDVCLASVQKCFALPPGLAVASVSNKALEKAKQVTNRGYYFDFLRVNNNNEKRQTLTTPPIPQIRALAFQLDYILNKEGLEERFKRHTRLGKRTRIWARDMNLEMFSDDHFASNTVSTIKNSFNINLEKLISEMIKKGFRIANGYGKLKDKTFRIGHMGQITLRQLEDMLKTLSDTITRIRLDL